MSNLMQNAAGWFAARMAQVAGRSVTYRRGAKTASLTGWVDSHTYQVYDGDGILTNYVADDWTFKVSSMLFGTETIIPQPGDRIEETLNSTSLVWEVMPVSGTTPYEWLDTSNTMVVVHTKRLQ